MSTHLSKKGVNWTSCNTSAVRDMEKLYMVTQDGLKTIALTLFLNLFFYFLLQLLCVMISNWLKVLKNKMPSQILIETAGLAL